MLIYPHDKAKRMVDALRSFQRHSLCHRSPFAGGAKVTITEIRARNKAAGFYFFNRASMRFFASRIESGAYAGADGASYFITSEQSRPSSGPPGPRRYTLRRFDPVIGDISTVGKFQAYSTLANARIATRMVRK